MEESTIKEKVLKRVRNALLSKTLNPYPDIDLVSSVFEPLNDIPDVSFVEEFTKVGGKFIYCENMNEMISGLGMLVKVKNLTPLFCSDPKMFEFLNQADIPFVNDKKLFAEMNASITFCEFLIARLGSIMVSSHSGPGRRINVFPNVHIVIAYSNQLVLDLKHAFAALKEKYPQRLPSMISVITGPSRTADIEKTLVMGAHGPKELYLFMVENTD